MKKKQRHTLVGIALIVMGAILLLWAYNISSSFGGRLSSAFTGSPGDKAMILYILGVVCAAVGIFRLLK